MKKLNLFSFALAALMLGACSSENDFGDGGQSVAVGEKGYVSMSINLPTTTKGTRGVSFDDGTYEEYKVNNAKLLIFAGEKEAVATCSGVYDLDISAFLENGSDQITSTAQIVQAITKPAGAHLYALVVLNDNGLITSEEFNGKSFSYFYTTAKNLTVAQLNGDGFFMSNSPLNNVGGGKNDPSTGNVTTLATIDASKIFGTENEALNAPAATVYVERALGKVTLNGSTTLSSGHNENIASYTIAGWTLDNTNKKTYLVRNVTNMSTWLGYVANNNYRFVESSPLETGVFWYRTYFGIDPNYTGTYTPADEFNMIEPVPATLSAADGKDAEYCLENTFDVDGMKDINTTRAIVAAKLNVKGAESGSGDFYLLNNNTSVIYTKESVIKEVKRIWMNYLGTIINTYVKNGTFTEGNVTVTLSNVVDGAQENGGFVTVTSIVMDDTSLGIEYQDGKSLESINEAARNYLTTINSEEVLTIAYYKGGVAYYEVLIKHFGNSETPWTAPVSGTESYPDPDKEQKWLGRYGILRNNWYELSVTGLKNIGSPEVPDVVGKWDDQVEQYISVEINILPWAKRSQEVEL